MERWNESTMGQMKQRRVWEGHRSGWGAPQIGDHVCGGGVCGGVCMVVCVWWYAGGVPLAPECSGQPVCAWPPWPLPRSVPEPEPWPCQSLRQQTSINTKTYYRASCCCDTRADTHSHTHSTHVSGYATLQSTNKSFLNSFFSQTLCGYVQSNNHLYAFSEAHILFHYRV